MNAVEAVQQLAELGRRMQARELDLQQPLAALHLAGEWDHVLADPLAALSMLLANAGAGQVQTKNADGETTVGSAAPFRWEEEWATAARERPVRRDAAEGGQSGEILPAEGVRLARKQAALVRILNANLGDRAEGGEHGHSVQQAAPGLPTEPARSVVRPEERLAKREGTRVDPLAPARGNDAQMGQDRAAERPAPAGTDDLGQPSSQRTRAIRGAEQDAVAFHSGGPVEPETVQDGHSGVPGVKMGAPEASSANAEMSAQADAWVNDRGSQSGSVAQDGQGSVLHPGGPLARQGRARQDGGDGYGADGVLRGWGATPAAQDDVWAMAAGAHEARPLSMAQIEQVLAVLDERLELMLLRMYGSAGGLP